MRLCHGSAEIVRNPSFDRCRPHNDFGPGFYCTEDMDLAREWACFRRCKVGYCNEYALNDAGLTTVDLDAEPYGPLNWIALLLRNRPFDARGNELARALFIEKYDVDLSDADIVIGYRADDSYFGIARDFLNGAFTDLQVEKALRLGQLGRQVVIRSKTAFERLDFVRAEEVDDSTWYPRWHRRDTQARQMFQEMHAASVWADGKRIYELVR